jgi:hypothetical protein
MQSYGFHDLGRKPRLQTVGSDPFVPGVHAIVGDVFAEVVEQVTKVMQQTRGHDWPGLTGLFRKRGTLEGVLPFGDVFAIAALAAFGEDPEDFIHDGDGRHDGSVRVSVPGW